MLLFHSAHPNQHRNSGEVTTLSDSKIGVFDLYNRLSTVC